MSSALAQLNPKQAAFVRHYATTRNGTQSAIDAGYARAGAHVRASRLLTNAKVVAALEEYTAPMIKELDLSYERVMKEYAALAFSNMQDLFDDEGNLRRITDLDEQTARALSSVELNTVEKGEGVVEHVAKIKLSDKRSALDSVAKILQLMGPENVVNNDNRTIVNVTVEEKARRIAAAIAKGANNDA